MKISKNAQTIIKTLYDNGYEGYLVGGTVRNFLMDKPLSDIDITTNATPLQLEGVFSSYKVIKTGLKHGTLTVLLGGEPIEITTYRLDSEYSDNRHPDKVEFVSNLHEDLKRRDFTINAIAYNDKEGLVDLFNGQEDIKNKIIRTVGNANKRFNEDSLRILRGLRFSSVLSFTIEKNTKKSIIKNKTLLKNVSVERVFIELKKMLLGDNIGYVLKEFSSVLVEIIPELKNADFKKLATLLNLTPKNEILRLAVLLSSLNKEEVFKILNKFKCDNFKKKTILFLIANKDLIIKPDDLFLKLLLKENEEESLKYLLEFKKIVCENFINYDLITIKIDRIISNNECYLLKHLNVNGNDLKSLGYSGSQIKIKLEELLLSVMKGEVKNEKQDLLNRLKND